MTADLYRRALLDDVVPFWLRHGMDYKYGGIMTCLNRDGSIIDHADGRLLNPGHAMEGAWFILREGAISSRAKGTLWKRPFHLPRMLWYCDRLLRSDE